MNEKKVEIGDTVYFMDLLNIRDCDILVPVSMTVESIREDKTGYTYDGEGVTVTADRVVLNKETAMDEMIDSIAGLVNVVTKELGIDTPINYVNEPANAEAVSNMDLSDEARPLDTKQMLRQRYGLKDE